MDRPVRAAVGMSGGVDSSAAAWLLQQQGYEVVGVTMKLFGNDDIAVQGESRCCSLDDVEDARAVARRLNIPHYVFNFGEEFRRCVMEPFAAAYERGETPNPCVECNRCLKFGVMLRRGQELDWDMAATGHYVRLERDEGAGRWLLKRAAHREKDQSYVLWPLDQQQLAHSLFPLGGLSKAEVRQIAAEQGFVNARKGTTPPSSAGIRAGTTPPAPLWTRTGRSWAPTRASSPTPWVSAGGWGSPLTTGGCMSSRSVWRTTPWCCRGTIACFPPFWRLAE